MLCGRFLTGILGSRDPTAVHVTEKCEDKKFRDLFKHRTERGLLKTGHVVVDIHLEGANALRVKKPFAGWSLGRAKTKR